MRARATAALFVASLAAVAAQPPSEPFVPVGVLNDRPGELGAAEIAQLRKLRFSIVARRDPAADRPLDVRARILPGPDADPGAPLIPVAIDGVGFVSVRKATSAADVRRDAWMLIGRGYPGVIFDGWTTLQRNPAAFQAAADFADVVTRNAALFAPLRASARQVRVDVPSAALSARFVESPDAMVLVAANLTDSAQRVTFTFTSDTPEAIWQNMESGSAINFVAGPDGPMYTRTFPPHDVMVLMIRKRYK
jgi:hypothetical protein